MSTDLPPVGTEWTIGVEPTAGGVAIEFSVTQTEAPFFRHYRVQADRVEARNFARQILAAAGDAMERTFPKPAEAKHG